MPELLSAELLARYADARIPRYTSYPTAPNFSAEVGEAQYRQWLASMTARHGSLYLHIPFCRAMCWYCGCHTTVAAREAPVVRYLDCLRQEMELVGRYTRGLLSIRHVHLGGGTPTLMPHRQLQSTMAFLRSQFEVAPEAEIAIEIDPRTGATCIESYVAVDDLGNIVSPQLVRGQVHGGVVQGAGQAFQEAAIYDPETGQLLSGTFTDYAMPRAGLLRSIVTDSHPVPTALNALGAKGVGESGCSGSLPALGNAMAEALRGNGLLLDAPLDMPYTPARVWQAIRSARRAV